MTPALSCAMTEMTGHVLAEGLTTGPIEQEAAGSFDQAVLLRVRAGRNKNFDRLVFDFEGPAPGHRVQYVPQLIQDGSGRPIPLRGRAVVEIVLRPAVAHRDDGSS